MDKKPPEKQAPISTKTVKANARAERLRAQLRQNLHRRKAQTRARKSSGQTEAE